MEDDADLKTYCYQVAGTVGLLMCGVLGVDDPRAFPHAIDLGIGMQLTNIARDVAEDAEAGRRYLPASLVGQLEPQEIASGAPSIRPVLESGVKALLQDAERYYRSGESGLAYLPPRARLGIFVASRMYNAIGSELRRQRFASWRERATVGLPRKLVIATGTGIEYMKCACLQEPPASHNALLHLHLSGYCGADTVTPAS
jgi:phytoene synthase